MNSSYFRGSVLVALLALVTANVAAQQATGSFERTLSINEPVRLDVRSGSGAITVRTGAAGEIEVTGRIAVFRKFGQNSKTAEQLVRRIEADPPIELSGSLLRIGHVDQNEFRNASISYEIRVPIDTEVSSHTGSGAQTISGVSGPLQISAGSGSLTLSEISGPVEASTGSGSIRAEQISGAFEGRTGSGTVRLVQSAPGSVVVSTGSGSSELIGIEGSLRVRAGSGRVTVEGRQSGEWNLETGSGSVRVRLPEDAAFELDARAGSGGIHIDHPITVQGGIDRGRLSGQVRDGDSPLRIRTGSGAIRIE